MNFDTVLEEINDFGYYQKTLLWIILLPGIFPCGFHAYNTLFMASIPDHWCKVPELNKFNYSDEFVRNISIPVINNSTKFEKCIMYQKNYQDVKSHIPRNINNLETKTCADGWTFNKTKFHSTVVSEWQLVCGKEFYITFTLVMFGASGLVGNYIFGYIQDSLGRKPAFYIYLLIQSIFGIATSFANNFWLWFWFRVGVGFTVPAILASPYVIAIEIVGPRHRTTITILTNIAYSLSLISLAVIVWIIRDWRVLSLATTIPFMILFLFWNVLPESPRWLVAKKKYKEADKILQKIAKANGKQLSNEYIEKLIETDNEGIKSNHRFGILDLFKGTRLRFKTIIITFIWFTNTSVYVGLSYYAPILNGDEFLNFFLAGFVELPTYLFLWPAMERYGRRWTLCISMMIGGFACLATFLVPNDDVVTLALYCIGKMGISSSFVVLPLIASELYPTVVRGLGMSFSSVIGMLGPVFIPLINYLGENMIVLPLIIMGSLLLFGGIFSLFLPETLNSSLPQTLNDAEIVGLECTNCLDNSEIEIQMKSTEESNFL